MEVYEALQEKQQDIVSLWTERTLDSYKSSGFLKKTTNRFANPVGSTITMSLKELFTLLMNQAKPQELHKPLDHIIRIRAVQDFTPSQAVTPILELKWVVKQIFSAQKETRALLPELDNFDCDVDRAALLAFDIYTACREQLYRGRVREIKSGRHILTDSGCPSKLISPELQAATNQPEEKKSQ